jgi:hypothetical protein
MPYPALLGLVLAAPVALASAEESRIFGTRPGEVMVMVHAQFSEELDEEIWHLPLAGIQSIEGGLAFTLEGLEGTSLPLPLAEGRDPDETAELIRSAVGHLLRLEYHPAQPVPRGRIHASWTLSSERSLVGDGIVPLGSTLYRRILAVAPADLPDTGIFAAIAEAQNRYALFVEHVVEGDAHNTDELYRDFKEAAEDANTSLAFYKTAEGRPVTQEHLDQLVADGHVRSANLYWREAVQKYDEMEPVNEILNNFVAEWERCPPGTEIVGPFPGVEKERVVDIDVIDEFRRAAARRFLAEAVLCAEAENPWLMRDNLDMFRQEIAAAEVVGQTIDPNDFVPENYETFEEFEANLERKASGRLNLWERVLAYFKTLNSNNQNFASPAGE